MSFTKSSTSHPVIVVRFPVSMVIISSSISFLSSPLNKGSYHLGSFNNPLAAVKPGFIVTEN
jgi:hypothetical protein